MNNEQRLETFFKRIEQRDDLKDDERHALIDAAGEVRVFNDGDDLVRDGDRPTTSTLLTSGLAARYKLMEQGERQITAFHVAGDFIDLHSFLLKQMDHGVRAMSDCTVVLFPHEALKHITEQYPHLTRMLWLLTLLDSAIHRQWLAAKGQLSARGHMAHLLCEQLVRARTVGIADGESFMFPITQTDLGDAMGISTVHVNRTLQELRSMGLVEWQNNRVQVLDEERLRRVGQFDDEYLHLEKLPR
jgi:CRP-like cAMP-binding protein